MKTLEFYQANEQTKKEIQEAISDYHFNINSEAPEWLQGLEELSTWSESFNIECVCYDDGTLIDYRIFDPFHQTFKGYTDGQGWSHWQNDAFSYLPDEEQEEVRKLGYYVN